MAKLNLNDLTKTCGKGFAWVAAFFGGNEVLKAALSKLATDRVQKVADDVLGSSTAQAQKDTIDENYLEILCQMGVWSKENRTEIEDFRDELWEKGGIKGKRTGSDEKHAFTLAIAKMMLTASEVLSSTFKQKNGKKGKNSPKPKITEEGISVADNWLKNFLEKYSDFDSRYLYIRKFGVFQLVEERKIGKLEKVLKNGWVATKKESLIKMAKNLPEKSMSVIEAIYDKGSAIATSEVIKNTTLATMEEAEETLRFGADTVKQIISGGVVVFLFCLAGLCFLKGWLFGFSLIGITLLIIVMFLFYSKNNRGAATMED